MNTNMFNNKVVLRAAMLLALGTTQATQAASISDGTPFDYAYELRNTSPLDVTVPAGLIVPIVSGRTVYTGPNQAYYIKIVLKGGAVFNGEPGVPGSGMDADCSCADDDDVECVIDKQNAVMGLNTLVYVVTAGPAVGANPKVRGSTCKLPTFGVKLSSGATTYQMDVTVTQPEPGVAVPFSKTTTGPYISFKQAFTLNVLSQESIIDVGGTIKSTDFLVGGNVLEKIQLDTTNSGRIARIGTLEFKNSQEVLALNGTKAKVENVLDGSVRITVSGLPLVAAVDNVPNAAHSGRIFLAPANTPNGRCESSGADDSFAHADQVNAGAASQAAANNSVSFDLGVSPGVFSAGVPAGGNGVWGGVDVCYVANGTTRISKGTINVEATGGGKAILTLADPTLGTVKRNGTSVKVLNISADPLAGGKDVTFIRIYNLDSRTANIYASLYDQTGKKIIPENSDLVSIDPKAVSVWTRDSLVTKFTLPAQPWTGRAWMQVEADSPKVRVQALMRSSGTLINLSERVAADNECLARSDTKVDCTAQ